LELTGEINNMVSHSRDGVKKNLAICWNNPRGESRKA